ncbi:MAG: RNA polymerase sigma factor [Clostridiales bacterium]|nr:RNA polymerase sigma factor [Clostridiales bacterium]
MDDRTIVQKYWDRDEEAIAESKRQYKDYCLYIADNVLHDRQDAEECLDDALLAAWNSIPPHRPENLRTYLGKLVREAAINRWKMNTRQKRIRAELTCPLDELEELVSDGFVGDAVEEAELSRAISRFLYSVDETKRNVFIRRYWYCDSVAGICARYGFGKSKVLMMLKRTRDDLAAYLKKEGFLT